MDGYYRTVQCWMPGDWRNDPASLLSGECLRRSAGESGAWPKEADAPLGYDERDAKI